MREKIFAVLIVLLFLVPYVCYSHYVDSTGNNKDKEEYLQAILEETRQQNELLEKLLEE